VNKFEHCFKYVFQAAIAICIFPAQAGSYEDFFAALERDEARPVAALLKRGFDPNTHNPAGQPALIRAIQAGAMQVADALMVHPQVAIDATNEAGETALMMAALKGQLELARRLLERGAKPAKPGWAPIHYAATGPEPKIVALLLDRGAPIDAASPTQRTALMMAARYGPEESVRLLLARGADPKRRNELGQHAGDFARMAGRDRLAGELAALAR
jgi:uncharacterized protein